jgi:hypothetical protein
MAVLADQPFAYWRLDDPPGSTVAHDVMGHADGMYLGSCQLGQSGALSTDTAVRFDGTTCFVDIAPVAQLSFPGLATYTIEAWVLPDPGKLYMHVFTREIRSTAPDAPIDGYALLLPDSGNAEAERSVNRTNITTTNIPIAPGDFRYLAATYDGVNMTLYIDMGERSLAPAMTMLNPVSIDEQIGAASPTVNFFSGTIDEVAIYDHVLPSSRLVAHFTARD